MNTLVDITHTLSNLSVKERQDVLGRTILELREGEQTRKTLFLLHLCIRLRKVDTKRNTM